VSIFEPKLDLLRQVFGNSVQDCYVELIRMVLGWRRVYRVTLSRQGHSTRESVIVKTLGPNGPATALEAERELRFYQEIHPQLSIPKPHVYHLSTDKKSGFHLIVMEDLSLTHHLPTYLHQWTRSELKCVLRTYAHLHTHSFKSLDEAWLMPRHESLVNFELIPEQVANVQCAGIWGELPGLPDLIAYARASCKKFGGEKTTLLHGDTTPTNAFLPKILDSQLATLIDWIDVGIGMPEFDLAYLDLQPFESGRLIPRSELLDLYWCARSEMDPDIPSPEERHARQLHADVVMALWLTGSASRVALRPYPEGTYPHMHWSSQFGIVYNRLKTLAQEI
jgi:aminoglycoside phosphotransferase (APT) family kinase protein